MNKYIKVVALLLTLSLLPSCVQISPVANTTNIQEVDFSKKFKKGEDCASLFFGFIPLGNASIVRAAKRAGIARVEFVDYKTEIMIFVFRRCVVVYGH